MTEYQANIDNDSVLHFVKTLYIYSSSSSSSRPGLAALFDDGFINMQDSGEKDSLASDLAIISI